LRYFIQLSFKGTHYHGWQKQKNANSVQAELEKALSTLLGSFIETIGCGRTDAGVHARIYFAHFDSPSSIKNPDKFSYQLNRILPFDISVYWIKEVISSAHARFDAISRTYEYHIIFEKNPFEEETSLLLHKKPDISILSETCRILFEYTDYTSFSKLHSDNKTNICKIFEASWYEIENKFILRIKADRFLRNMVRSIVGSMLDVGNNKLSINGFREIIEARDRSKARISAPAHGLYLVDVEYPSNILQNLNL